MGKRERRERDAKNARARLEELLARGDTRAAVDAAKLLLREEPGAASESLAIRAYVRRIEALIAEGLGREAAGIAAIVRERFPAHVASCTPVLEDARLAAGDFDWVLCELHTASDERRAALEERLLPWITDPAAIARSSALDPTDPLALESRAAGELFEIVTSRIASADEMARLGEIRRRSPLAPWKLLLRAIDSFYRNEDERVGPNLAAIDGRSPAARAGKILSEMIAGRQSVRPAAAARLVDQISGGRATIATLIRSIEDAARQDDRRRLRDDVRALTRSFDKLTPYAVDQVRMALVAICGPVFSAEQTASLLRIDEHDPAMMRYAALLMECSGLPFADKIWIAYGDELSTDGTLQPWQAAEIYLHALSLGVESDEPILFDVLDADPLEEPPHKARVIEAILAARPAPSTLSRVLPFLDRLESRELRRILTAWRRADPNAPEPLLRLMRIAEKERKYDDALASIRQGDALRIIDPEYARLRQRIYFRKVEQLLVARKRGAAAVLVAEIAGRPEDLGDDGGTYLLALQWATAPPEKAGEPLAELARRGMVGEIVMAEVTGDLGMQFALPASHPSPEELLEGVCRGLALLKAVGRLPRHSFWLVERAEAHLDRASEAQLITIGSVAWAAGMTPLAWKATGCGLELGGPLLHRSLLLRAEVLMDLRPNPQRILDALDAARSLAEEARDSGIAARAADLADSYRYFGTGERLSSEEIAAIVAREQAAPMPRGAGKQRRKKIVSPKSKSKRKVEKGLFEP